MRIARVWPLLRSASSRSIPCHCYRSPGRPQKPQQWPPVSRMSQRKTIRSPKSRDANRARAGTLGPGEGPARFREGQREGGASGSHIAHNSAKFDHGDWALNAIVPRVRRSIADDDVCHNRSPVHSAFGAGRTHGVEVCQKRGMSHPSSKAMFLACSRLWSRIQTGWPSISTSR